MNRFLRRRWNSYAKPRCFRLPFPEIRDRCSGIVSIISENGKQKSWAARCTKSHKHKYKFKKEGGKIVDRVELGANYPTEEETKHFLHRRGLKVIEVVRW